MSDFGTTENAEQWLRFPGTIPHGRVVPATDLLTHHFLDGDRLEPLYHRALVEAGLA